MDIKIIDQYKITNNQVLNYIDDITDEESKRIFEPLNCISWTLGHLARYNNLTFAARSRGVEIPNEFKDFENGAPHSQKDLSYVKGLWIKTLKDTEKFLDGLNENDLVKILDNDSNAGDNLGTVIKDYISSCQKKSKPSLQRVWKVWTKS